MKFKQRTAASVMLIMKITIVQLLMFVVFVCSLYAKEVHGQNILEKRFTLSVENRSLEQVVALVKAQTDVDFSFSTSLIKNELIRSISVSNIQLGDFLKENLGRYNIGFRVVQDQVVLFNNANADKIVITGKVVDSKGFPIPGVTVKVKGTLVATSTDTQGQYSITINSTDDVLVFSSVGFAPQEQKVGTSKTVNVTLSDKSGSLDEVVVVAYGVQKKATITGSIATITTKDLVQSPVVNISNSLVGRLSGLFASQASGEPGADQSTIRIRGISTFSGNTDPLIIVDGIEVPNYNNIDPNEIESLSILKDASTTAVYGIRGANGVILITTKRGRVGAPQFTYTFNQAINSFTKVRTPMDAVTYATDLNQALLNQTYTKGGIYTPKYSAADIQLFRDGTDPILHPNINWFDVILKKTSGQQTHNLNVSGGTNSIKYFFSGGYTDQAGLFKDTKYLVPDYDPNTDYRRINFRSNFDFQVNKRLKITVDVSTQNEQRSGNNANTNTVIDAISNANPVDAALPVDGKIVNVIANANNPLTSLLSAGYHNQYTNYLNSTLRLNHQLDFITPGLNVRASYTYQNFNSINYVDAVPFSNFVTYTAQKQTDGSIVYIPSGYPAPYGFSTTQAKYRKEVYEGGFDYDRKFGNHAFTALLLYRQQKLNDPTLAFLVPKGYQSVIGRADYNYKGRYLAQVTGSYEGSENFAPDRRFGFFTAYSAGWVPSEEPFFPKNDIVNFLKFSGSYGTTGYDVLGGSRFLYNPTSYTYTTGSGYYFGDPGSTYQLYNGAVAGSIGNPNLTWERSVDINLAMDIYMFKSALTMKFEAFQKKRNNILLVPATAPLITGYQAPAQNLGIMQNRGLEADVSYNNNIRDFNYTLSGNFSFARNKIIYSSEVPQIYPYRNTTGQRYGQYYGLIAEGFFNSWAEANDPNRPVYYANVKVQPGDVKYKDVNGDGIINDDDMVPIGYSNVPEITYGFSLRGSYKGFDFSALFQGVGNVSIAYSRKLVGGFFDTPNKGAINYLDQSWTQQRYDQGLPINFPRFAIDQNNPNYSSSTLFTADAKYLRLKNAEIGYTFKTTGLKKLSVRSARIFINGNNLVTWSGVFQGVDPENPSYGANSEPYGLVRTVNMGLNVGF